MEIEIIKAAIENGGSVVIVAIGLFYLVAKQRDRKANPVEHTDYVTKAVFYEQSNQSRELSDKRNDKTLKAIADAGKEFHTELAKTNQNHLDHVSNHGD